MSLTILTEDRDGSSLFHMAKDLQKRYQDCDLMFKVGKPKAETVLVLRPDWIPKLLSNWRLHAGKKVVGFFTPNPEEFKDFQLAEIMVACVEHKVQLIAHSKTLERELQRRAVAILSGTLYRKFISEVLWYIPWGIGPEFAYKKGSRDVWIVPFNRFNESQKRMTMHQNLTSMAQILCKLKTQTTYMNVGADLKDVPDTCPYHIRKGPTRAEYVQHCKEAGIFISTARYESFGIMYLELLASGVVGVFVDAPWVRSLLPGYKLVAKAVDVPALVMGVYHDFDKASEYVRSWSEKIHSDYSINKFSETFIV